MSLTTHSAEYQCNAGGMTTASKATVGLRPGGVLARSRPPCASRRLLRVRLTERALRLCYCAPEARFRLSRCALEIGLFCASSGSSLLAATYNL